MTNIEFISLLSSIASLILAVLAIWLSLYHKKESDAINEHVRSLLTEVRSDAKVVTTFALPELQKYSDAMVDHVFYGKNRSIAGKESLLMPRPLSSDESTVAALSSKRTDSEPDLLAEFENQVGAIHSGGGFKASDRDSALRLAKKIKEASLQDDPEFKISLEQLIDSFASADQNRFVDALDDLFPDITLSTSGINQTIIQSLGMRILEIDSPSKELARRFARHFEAAKNNDILQYALPWKIVDLYSHGQTQELRVAIEELKAQDQVTKLGALDLLNTMKSPSDMAKRATPKILRVAEKTNAFLSSEEGAEVLAIGDDA